MSLGNQKEHKENSLTKKKLAQRMMNFHRGHVLPLPARLKRQDVPKPPVRSIVPQHIARHRDETLYPPLEPYLKEVAEVLVSIYVLVSILSEVPCASIVQKAHLMEVEFE